MRPDLSASLRRHYLFAALSDPQWARLEHHVSQRHLLPGERLFLQGEPAHAFFIVGSGCMKLFRTSERGVEKIMRLVRTGQSFAEGVLFFDPPRYPVHAHAVNETLLAAVERDAYMALLRESFDTCRAVMAQMVQRIYAHWDEIETLSLHGSQARVARYLLDLQAGSRRGGVPDSVRLPARKTLIAARLGLAPETLSRALHSLSESGLICVKGSTIRIRDAQALRTSADS